MHDDLDIKLLLDQMLTTTDELANLFEQDDPQFADKMHTIAIVKENIERLQTIYPDLLQLMKDRPRFEAIRQMSMEWRTPQVLIIGYSQLMQEGHIGSFSNEELSLIAQLKTIAEQVRDWSSPR